MERRTKLQLAVSEKQILPDHKVVMAGSCFTENIGLYLEQEGRKVMINPFGIVFHPIPLARAMSRALNGEFYREEELVFDQGKWSSMDHHHGRFSMADKKATLDKINERLQQTHEWLKSTNWLIITFGTAWGYRFLQSGEIAANCHKIPQKAFTKELIEVNEITEAWNELLSEIRKENSDLQTIFTVSPVRHWKDGPINNTLSKAHLIKAVHELVAENDQNHYFPAYEIVLDELRDYKYFKEDMLHPNDEAIEIVWERFAGGFLRAGRL